MYTRTFVCKTTNLADTCRSHRLIATDLVAAHTADNLSTMLASIAATVAPTAEADLAAAFRFRFHRCRSQYRYRHRLSSFSPLLSPKLPPLSPTLPISLLLSPTPPTLSHPTSATVAFAIAAADFATA